MQLATTSTNTEVKIEEQIPENVIDLEGKEFYEDGYISTPSLVAQIKEVLNRNPEAKTTIYFWLSNQAKLSLQRVQ